MASNGLQSSNVAPASTKGPSESTQPRQDSPEKNSTGTFDSLDENDIDPEKIGQVDAQTESRVLRKLDWNLMPLFFVLYMLSFLDRSNVGNARTAGMAKDLNLIGDRYDWLLTIFYITYILFEFTVLLWKIVPPHVIASITIFCCLIWLMGRGLMATVQAGTHSWGGTMAIRFLLGIFEAAYASAIIYFLSFFYLRHEVGFRCGIFVSAAPLASTFAGALAYGITHGHSSLANWRLLFLVEGLPTILMAPIAYFFIPDVPDKARFLNPEEKAVAKARGVCQTGNGPRIGAINFKDLGLTLIDLKAWLTAIMYFSANVSYASLPVFLPTILKDMGFSSINAQGLSAPPYFVSFFFSLLTAWVADRLQQRGLMCFTVATIGGIGYIVLATVSSVGVRYFAVFLAAAGVFPTIANILPWVLNNQGSDTRRGTGIVLISTVGQCGSILATRLYPTSEKPRYVKGMSVCAAFMFFTALVALALRLLLVWENRKLGKKYGTSVKEPRNLKSSAAAENYGPNFRFVL